MISKICDYYLSTYGNKTLTKYDTHKKSELRNIYNTMVKINKYSPLFSIPNTDEVQHFAVDLKEHARSLENITAALEDDVTSAFSGFEKKKAYSSDAEAVSVEYSGDIREDDLDTSFDVEVINLASPQINTGHYLGSDYMALQHGTYAFNIDVGDYSYEFQYNIEPSDTNKSVQEKIARLINRNNIGITAEVLKSEDGKKNALQLTSTATGSSTKHDYLFHVTDSRGATTGSVNYLGLQNITQEAQDALFTVNGTEHSASSNNFTINKTFDVTLHQESVSKEPIHIGFKTDIDSIMENIEQLVSGYNSMIDFANDATTNDSSNNKLQKDICLVAKKHRSALESAGLNLNAEGKLDVDSSLIVQSVNEGTLAETLDNLSGFKNDLSRKAKQISINPMDYINKKLISYPNPDHTKVFTSPYMTSIYSGMMFNGYV